MSRRVSRRRGVQLRRRLPTAGSSPQYRHNHCQRADTPQGRTGNDAARVAPLPPPVAVRVPEVLHTGPLAPGPHNGTSDARATLCGGQRVVACALNVREFAVDAFERDVRNSARPVPVAGATLASCSSEHGNAPGTRSRGSSCASSCERSRAVPTLRPRYLDTRVSEDETDHLVGCQGDPFQSSPRNEPDSEADPARRANHR